MFHHINFVYGIELANNILKTEREANENFMSQIGYKRAHKNMQLINWINYYQSVSVVVGMHETDFQWGEHKVQMV